MLIANGRCIARPYKAETDTSEGRELYLVSVPAVDYIREAFFGVLALLADPDHWNPISDQAAEYGAEIVESLEQVLVSPEEEQIVTEIVITPATVFPVLLKSMFLGETADEVLVTIDTAFDAGVFLSVGDSVDNARLMPTSYNDLTEIGQFQVSPQYPYPAATDVYVYLTGVSPTMGSARITLYSYLAG